MNRRLTIALLAALAAPALLPAQAAPVRIRLGTLVPQGTSYHRILQEMGERWRTATNGRVQTTVLARDHLTPGGPLDVGDYIRLAAESPGVLALVENMRKAKPAGMAKDDSRAVFIFKEGLPSAMEEDDSARKLTLMLAGRAKNIAPVLAQKVDLSAARCVLDIGGGTGVYATPSAV